MENQIVTFASMTNAMKARDLLRSHKIPSKLIRTPAKLRKGSCGYSLVIGGKYEGALSLIRDKGIPYKGVFADDGA